MPSVGSSGSLKDVLQDVELCARSVPPSPADASRIQTGQLTPSNHLSLQLNHRCLLHPIPVFLSSLEDLRAVSAVAPSPKDGRRFRALIAPPLVHCPLSSPNLDTGFFRYQSGLRGVSSLARIFSRYVILSIDHAVAPSEPESPYPHPSCHPILQHT